MFSNAFSLSSPRDGGGKNGFAHGCDLKPPSPSALTSDAFSASSLASGPWMLESLAQGLGDDDSSPSADELWTPEEYGQILSHQLSAAIFDEFCEREQDPSTNFSGQSSSVLNQSNLRFCDVFEDPNPSPDVIKGIKEYAKSNRAGVQSCLPSAVATVLYFSVIAKGLNSGMDWITTLKPADLRNGYAWTLKTPWTPESLKSVVRQALSRLDDAAGAPGAGDILKAGGIAGEGMSGETTTGDGGEE